MLQSPQLLALIETFLAAVCDPQAGEALYDMHATDAIVRHGDTIGPAASVERASFARMHREIGVHAAEALPRYARPTLRQVSADSSSGAEAVVWFECTETRQQRSLLAALGVAERVAVARGAVEPALRTHQIGWCTLASRVHPWSYRDGALQSLADYPWLLMRDPASARVLLDASFFRQHWRAPVPLRTLPDARFSCQMSTVCCKHDFEIALPPEAQRLIDAIPWQTLKPELVDTQLPLREDGKLLLKELDETCRFLGAHRQCLIHQTLGRQPFGPCAIFPYAFASTPEGVAVSLSPICVSTRQGLGVAPLDREQDLRERLMLAEPRQANGYRLAPGIDISWENFRDIEQGLQQCLTADAYPMRRRLQVGARLLSALRDNEPVETQRWLEEPAPQISGELRTAVRDMLGKILAWDRAALRSLPRRLPPQLFTLEVCDTPIVQRILQNVLFSKVYSYPFDLTTAYNFLIVLYLLTLIMQAACDGPLTDVLWQELGSLGVHGLLKNLLHEGIPEGFRTVFGTSEFGQWALAA